MPVEQPAPMGAGRGAEYVVAVDGSGGGGERARDNCLFMIRGYR